MKALPPMALALKPWKKPAVFYSFEHLKHFSSFIVRPDFCFKTGFFTGLRNLENTLIDILFSNFRRHQQAILQFVFSETGKKISQSIQCRDLLSKTSLSQILRKLGSRKLVPGFIIRVSGKSNSEGKNCGLELMSIAAVKALVEGGEVLAASKPAVEIAESITISTKDFAQGFRLSDSDQSI